MGGQGHLPNGNHTLTYYTLGDKVKIGIMLDECWTFSLIKADGADDYYEPIVEIPDAYLPKIKKADKEYWRWQGYLQDLFDAAREKIKAKEKRGKGR